MVTVTSSDLVVLPGSSVQIILSSGHIVYIQVIYKVRVRNQQITYLSFNMPWKIQQSVKKNIVRTLAWQCNLFVTCNNVTLFADDKSDKNVINCVECFQWPGWNVLFSVSGVSVTGNSAHSDHTLRLVDMGTKVGTCHLDHGPSAHVGRQWVHLRRKLAWTHGISRCSEDLYKGHVFPIKFCQVFVW